jgi:hypothetical protein
MYPWKQILVSLLKSVIKQNLLTIQTLRNGQEHEKTYISVYDVAKMTLNIETVSNTAKPVIYFSCIYLF